MARRIALSLSIMVVLFLCSMVAQTQYLANQGPAPREALGSREETTPGQSGLISLRLRDVPLAVALEDLKRRAGVRITYSSDLLPQGKRVSIDVSEVPTGEALSMLLKGTGLDYLVLESGMIALGPKGRVEQETGTVKGKVTDAKTNEPLPGGNVLIEGTRYGAATDQDGNYRIDRIPPGTYTLIARFIGYESGRQRVRVTVGEELTLNLQLTSTVLGLDEVVVTGTAVATEKRQLGNSVSTVSSQELELSGSPAIDRALSGKFAGVLVQQNSGNPAGGVSVRLRGVATILGNADPLYMIDGIIVNNDSPELLNLGGSAQNRLVDIDPNDVDRIEIVKGAAAAALYGSRANNGIVQIFTKRGRYGTPQISYSTSAQWSQIRKTLEVNEYPFDKRIGDATAKAVTRYDWQDYMFRNALGTEQSLSISGGAGGTRYVASGSYTGNEGIMKGVSYQRGSARLGIDHTVNDWLNLTLDARYIRSGSKDIPNGGLPANWGAIPGFLFGPNTFDPRPDPVTGVYPHLGSFENPVEVIDLYDYQQKVNRFVGGTKLVLNPMQGLTAEYILGYDTYNQSATAFIPVGTSAPGYTNGFARRAERDFYAVNNDLNISYKTSLTPEMQSTTSIGATVQYENTSSISAQSSDLSPVARIVPGGATQSIGESRSEQSVYGFFAQQTVGLWNRFFVTAAGRVDASSVFGEDNRWQFYPKLSASYVISDEGFWKSSGFSDYVPSLKLRTAVGESGGLTAIGPYDRFTTFPAVTYDNKAGVVPSSQLGATNVKPERQRGIEVGFDAGFLSNRLALELSYYTQHTRDLLLTRSLAYTTGYSTQLENVGTLDNKGLEFLIRGVPFDGDIRWSVTLVYATNKNEVNDIEGGVRTLPDSYSITAAVNGQALGVFYGSNFQRDANNNIVYDAGGLPIRSTANKVIGDPNPKYTASLTNEVQIGKQWSFRIQLDAVQGNKTFNFARRIGIYPVYGTLKDYEKELKGEYPAGYNTRVFGIYENWIEDGSFVKLREVSLSYIFYPTEWGLRSLMISVVGRNLISIDNYSGFDPEINIGGQRTGTRGFDFGEVPIPRSFSIKLTANL